MGNEHKKLKKNKSSLIFDLLAFPTLFSLTSPLWPLWWWSFIDWQGYKDEDTCNYLHYPLSQLAIIIFHLLLNLHDFQKVVEINITYLSPTYLRFYYICFIPTQNTKDNQNPVFKYFQILKY